MAYFAKLNSDNIVLAVHSVRDEDCINSEGIESEEVGIAFLQEIHGWTLWKKTSYNTREGKHYNSETGELSSDQSKAFRKNFAGIGSRYDPTLDAFIPPKLYDSWIIDETKGVYVAPVSFPSIKTYNTDKEYDIQWDEANQRWIAYDEETPRGEFYWDVSTLTWNASTN